MARRSVRIFLAGMTLNAALLAGAFAGPTVTLACSCVRQEGPIFSGKEGAVLMGTVGAHIDRGRHSFEVERWFKGGAAPTVLLQSASVPQGGGIVSFNTCGLDLEAGQHLILAASVGDGVLDPGACSPHAGVASPEGQAMVAAAINTFGEGNMPGAPPGPADPTVDLASIAIVTVVGLLVIIALGVVIATVGRREPPTQNEP